MERRASTSSEGGAHTREECGEHRQLHPGLLVRSVHVRALPPPSQWPEKAGEKRRQRRWVGAIEGLRMGGRKASHRRRDGALRGGRQRDRTVIRTMGCWSSECFEDCCEWTRRARSQQVSDVAGEFDEVDYY